MPRATTLGSLVALALLLVGLSPGEARAIGVLLPTRGDLEPLMVRYHRVGVTIRERAAETRIEQTFRNHTNEVLEATYVFPVPEGATVSGFAMWVNGQRQEGELLDAARARGIYEQIVARMRDPGLVEHMGGNLFRARVFPIAPNAEQRIELRFTQTLDYQSGVVHYRYPLRTGGQAARTLEDLTIGADIVSRTAIRAVYSPTHRISVARPDDQHATVGFEQGQTSLDQDFDLYYAVQDGDVGLSLLTHRTPGTDGYFIAMIAPRAEITEQEIAAKEVLFVFDTSGSMAGDKIDRAKAALDYMLARLRPSDHFQVLRFSTDVEALFDAGASMPASPENVRRARESARRFVAAGGTAIDAALVEALRTRAPAGALPRMVVFLTDGMPTIGETHHPRILENVARVSGEARLFVFGVGDDVNTTFLDQLAQSNRGVGDYFRDGSEMERRLSTFYDRVAYPLVTDLRLTIPGVQTFDVYPRDLGHLYRGDQLLVVGRFRGQGPSRIELAGRASHERQSRAFHFDVGFPAAEPANDWLARLWATRKIGFLLDEIRLRGERAELREEVVGLARTFGIVTPYTSYLVVEENAVPADLAPQLRTAREQPVGPISQARVAAQPAAPSGSSGDFAGFDGATSSFDFEESTVEGSMARPNRATTRAGGGARSRAPAAEPAAGGSGATGRAISRRLRAMREADRSDDAAATETRFVEGRTLRLVGGTWIDLAYRRDMRTLRVRWGSPAYFALVRQRADLRRTLSLGDRVIVVVAPGRAVRVEPDGPEGVSDADLTRFLRDGG